MTHRSATIRLARCTMSAAALLSAAGLAGCNRGARAPEPGDVGGRYIVAIGDADMAASAWADRMLGERDTDATDTLTVISLPIREPRTDVAQIMVSNSALGPPAALAVSRDGNYAYIAETRGPAGPNAVSVDELPVGQTVTGVDLTEPMRPRIVSEIRVGAEPTGVAVHPSGRFVATVTRTARQQLVIAPVEGGAPSRDAAMFPLLGLDDDSASPATIDWHPGGGAFAVTLPERGEVMFYKFREESDGELAILPWGSPLRVGKYPYAGVFTPDGRHYVVSDMQWGPDVDGFNVGAAPGQVVAVRIADNVADLETDAAGEGMHTISSAASAGVSPKGLAVSPDGTLVATANLQRSYLPDGDERLQGGPRGGSITLLTLTGDGQLTPVGEYAMNAVPAGLTFDREGRFVVATQFRSFDPDAVDGELAFWRVNRPGRGGTPSLEQGEFFVGAGTGPHGVVIVR